MALALFDLDNTLLNGDSDYQWGEFLVAKNRVNAEEYAAANARFYEDYKRGTLNIEEFCAFSFAPLAAHSMEELAALHAEFMQQYIIPIIRKKAQATIEKHRQQGDIPVIITATNSFITRPIATHLGIEQLLATEPKVVDGRYTTEIDGTPCFQTGKVTRLKQWMQQHNHNLEGSYFYSDSINDLPLLEVVDTPIVVAPDEKLKAVAQERNWQIADLD